MSDQNPGSTASSENQPPAEGKGKGKAVDEPQAMEEDDESSEEESGAEEQQLEVEEEDDDNMEEIDTENILGGGRRTRGKDIDFAQADQDIPADEEDYDEDADEDFEEEGGDDDDAMRD